MIHFSRIHHYCENALKEIGKVCHAHKKELLITGIALSVLGAGIAAAAVLSGKSVFVIGVAMANTIHGYAVPGWVGVTGMTRTGYQLIFGTCLAVAGLATMTLSGGLYAKK